IWCAQSRSSPCPPTISADCSESTPLRMSADGTFHAPRQTESTAGADDLLTLDFRMQERGEHELALEIYREAARVAPGYPRALLNVGNALQSLGRIDEAEEAYRGVVAIDPAFAYARFNLGML